MPVRPTLRCLTDNLGLKIPPIDDPLNELDHRHGWFPELAMPHRAFAPGEQLWSNLMDPVVASQLIDGAG